MADLAVRVDGLGKRYRLGARTSRYRYKTLRDGLAGAAGGALRAFRRRGRAADPAFWALKEVSFDVRRGEVLGVIGRNGSGKSTLLKILSRITDPTEGGVDLYGRVGSLLEVGTGFNPELTGRENVYLNGAMLGMGRAEIGRKFDEIVAFAEVDGFLDTPVKRYSSGMYTRLAFSVAAHLEPEILVVDEVLAVGDAAFQQKCLSKMSAVGRAGRTVLFVSHQLATVKAVCDRVIVLEGGRLVGEGGADEQVANYLSRLRQGGGGSVDDRPDREGNGVARITHLRFSDSWGPVERVMAGGPLRVGVGYRSEVTGSRPSFVALSFWSPDGHKLFHVDELEAGVRLPPLAATGEYVCVFPKLPLPPGVYTINAALSVQGAIADHLAGAATLEVLPGDFHGTGRPAQTHGGLMFVDHHWEGADRPEDRLG